ncbi:hypothetical protein VHUM_01992 [Vanrija humicola]|uniref:Aldose 1-epimerase n=1 Tax=Vanrija humicola TaxID=5417 RepID=A0A7D8Z4N8_VANHU|nr:hypothetical protein VHUM_01992 [Vanrija humicola]
MSFAALSAASAAPRSDAGLKVVTLKAEGIEASFIPYGARLTSLRVPDRTGEWREVNVGYADAAQYHKEKGNAYFGAVVGRYANRMAHGRFTVAGETYQVTNNDHDGQNALHGGVRGYDARDWAVEAQTPTSVTFALADDGFEGFPGKVLVHATYTVTKGTLRVQLTALPLDKATPILLTTHAYFNLSSTLAPTVLDDTLHVPQGSRVVAVDGISVPTGAVLSVSGDHPLNYTSPRAVRDGALGAKFCGDGGVGIDNCFLFDRPEPPSSATLGPAQVILASKATGIRLAVHTNQPAIQLYSGNGFDGSVETQLGKAEQYGSIAIEPQGWWVEVWRHDADVTGSTRSTTPSGDTTTSTRRRAGRMSTLPSMCLARCPRARRSSGWGLGVVFSGWDSKMRRMAPA